MEDNKKITPEQIEAWKKEHGTVWKYTTEDNNCAGVFRKPTRSEFGIYQGMIQKGDLIAASETLAKTCFVGGDEAVYEADKYFYELATQLQNLLETVGGEMEKL